MSEKCSDLPCQTFRVASAAFLYDTAPSSVEAEIIIKTGFKTSRHQTNRETEQTKGLKLERKMCVEH